MIELTVKTLDSQNHAFTVEDDITVAQFKAKIESTVNIPAEIQRMIYCGRVLQDEAKLKDYDVHGKVVHLVQRAPPVAADRSEGGATPRSASPQRQPHRRGLRVLEHGNAMYLGSVAFPSSLMEAQGIVPPPPTHSLAASRLNVARRMLKRAEAVIKSLEDPQSRPSNQSPPPEEPQEEVTPVFEARVIVPNMNEPIDQALVLSAVENSLLNVGAVPLTAAAPETQTENAVAETTAEANASDNIPIVEDIPEPSGSAESPPETNESRGESSSSNSNSGTNLQENASRTAEMAELLTMLGQLQVRFAPFLERYQNFMQEDQTVPDEDIRQTQTTLNRVSEVMHFLGHAYHSLSDIIVKARTPPPRALLCRPILIQQSAMVQTGFPIQLEAQINFTTDRPTTSFASTTSATDTTTTTSVSSSSANVATPPTITTDSNTGTAATASTTTDVSGQIHPSMVGIPFFPGATMRVQQFPIEFRGVSRNARPLPNNNGVATTQAQGAANSDGTSRTADDGALNLAGFGSNPNVQLFMEVTPEGVTVDSLESHLNGSNAAGDTADQLNIHEQEFVQSIMQIMNRVVTNVASRPQPSAPPAESTASATTTTTSTAQSPTGQNSQARGNTQTNPTTATHTRSTSRPHVHLAQHAMQGFDPFLPCNSHHVTSRRRIHIQNTAQQRGTAQAQPRAGREGAQNVVTQNTRRNLFYNFTQAVLNGFMNPQRGQSSNAAARSNVPTSGASNMAADPSQAMQAMQQTGFPLSSFSAVVPHVQEMTGMDVNRISPLALLFSNGDRYEEGQGLFSDFVRLISRNFTLGDLVQLHSGRLEPLIRIRSELRNYCFKRILDGSTAPVAVDRGVNRLIGEMQTLLDHLSALQVKDDIDIVRSVQMLFRARLPNIINLAISRSPNALRMLVDQCRITARQLCALILRASSRGQDGVLELYEQIVTHYMSETLPEIRQWTLATSRGEVLHFIEGLDVPESILHPYIVKKTEAVLPSVAEAAHSVTDEPMDLDSPASTSSTENANVDLSDIDGEPLPEMDMVIASEAWHSQLPKEWVPIIARDAQRQRRQNPQPPFSDAYISGMPSKRRKIVAASKPQGTLPQVITENVRRAVTATGLSTVAPVETVAQAAGTDLTVQAAYRDLLRTSVQATLENNEDFTPERFPNASNYFNKQ